MRGVAIDQKINVNYYHVDPQSELGENCTEYWQKAKSFCQEATELKEALQADSLIITTLARGYINIIGANFIYGTAPKDWRMTDFGNYKPRQPRPLDSLLMLDAFFAYSTPERSQNFRSMRFGKLGNNIIAALPTSHVSAPYPILGATAIAPTTVQDCKRQASSEQLAMFNAVDNYHWLPGPVAECPTFKPSEQISRELKEWQDQHQLGRKPDIGFQFKYSAMGITLHKLFGSGSKPASVAPK